MGIIIKTDGMIKELISIFETNYNDRLVLSVSNLSFFSLSEGVGLPIYANPIHASVSDPAAININKEK